ncbi:MAG TPA: MgtC/SapB family protein [Limnochordia bacterium]|nr:MgtC/SapB family protein [Limnochordia bacterium]
MLEPSDLELLGRVLLGTVLAAVWGMERELHGKSAGLRTYALVGLGAALITVVSEFGFLEFQGLDGVVRMDPARLVAQVVSGIGFLGGGLIIFHRNAVRGLTTAAGIWASAAIGIASGAGKYELAVGSTLLGIVVFQGFGLIERTLLHSKARRGTTLNLVLEDRPGVLGSVAQALGSLGGNILEVHLDHDEADDQTVAASFTVQGRIQLDAILDKLTKLPGVLKANEITVAPKKRPLTAKD